MKMALEGAVGVNSIKTYEPGRVQIRDRVFSSSLIVLRDQLITDWQPRSIDELRSVHLTRVLDTRPELVILGTGDAQIFPDPAAAPAGRSGPGRRPQGGADVTIPRPSVL